MKTLVSLAIGFSAGFLSLGACEAASLDPGRLAVRGLRAEYRVDPLGIDERQPQLSWIVESTERGERQTAYRVLVATSAEKLREGAADLWDSGRVESDATSQIVYGGKPLASRMRCHWKVRVWDSRGDPSAWSAPATWTMGLLESKDWSARWIGFDRARERPGKKLDEGIRKARWIWYPEGDPRSAAPVGTRYFRRAFVIPPSLPVWSATCTVAADNSAEIFVNGARVGQVGSFRDAVEFDIREHLRPGENVLAAAATNVGDAPNPAGLIASLRIEFEGGEPLAIVSGAEWKAAREAREGWNAAGFEEAGWATAKEVGRFGDGPWGEPEIGGGELFLPPPPYFRKPFGVAKRVARATVYASALGLYELRLNGRRVSEDRFTPGWTDYARRVYYQTYDVTDRIREGENVLGAILADGWYSGYIGWGRKRDHYGDKPRVLAQLELEFEDGTRDVVATDRTWRAATGGIREADFLMGEAFDARLEPGGWDAPGFDDASWFPADEGDAGEAALQAHPGVPVRAFAELAPKSVSEPAPGRFVFDLGQNFAGVARLKVAASPGTRIVLRFAERLNPDGTIYTTNLRGARATDTYISRGAGEEVWEPRFTFHGFQYVEVTGLPGKPEPGTIAGVALGSDTRVAGSFECSDEVANRLYRNICWTQRANFIEVPTDCPQRDERLGWMGDAQIFVRAATYNADVAAFFKKWMVDVEDAQLPNGAFPDVAPRVVATGGGTAAWGDAGVICPWTIYEVYGDTRILARHYDAFVRWIEHLKAHSKDLLRPAEGYGDWLSIGADTPKDVLATAYFAESAAIVAKIAEALGKESEAAAYRELFSRIRDAFVKAYVSEDGRVRGETQTAYVLALGFDLLPREKRPPALARLVADIEKRGWRLSTGFVGTKDLMKVLTEEGRTDVACRLFEQTEFPSWRFSIRHGATSIWERWDGWTPERGFQDPGMNSFAHYSFGAVGEWMFRAIGGIDTEGPGFRRLRIRPQPCGSLKWAKCRYDSIRGPIETSWAREGETFDLEVAIPANASATVFLPAADSASVAEGDAPLRDSKEVRLVRSEPGLSILAVPSGRYRFRSRI